MSTNRTNKATEVAIKNLTKALYLAQKQGWSDDEQEYILSVLDQLCGWCSSRMKLYDLPPTKEDFV